MELYILDDQLRRIQVIDLFESLIWSERYADVGDFQLTIASDIGSRAALTAGTLLAIDESQYVMMIEIVEKKTDSDGRAMLNVTGPSLESVMKNRLAKNTLAPLGTDTEWVLTGTPISIAKKIFKHICIDGALDPADIIPCIQEGDLTLTPGSWESLDNDLYWDAAVGVWDDAYAGYVSEGGGDTGEEIEIILTPTTVYQAIKELCDVYGIGFRLIRNGDNSELYFEVYNGFDRTTLQNDLPPVKFSADLDNLSDSTELDTMADSKTVAYVFSTNAMEIVYGAGDDPSQTGFERRVLYVEVDSDLPAGSELTTLLQQMGRKELAENQRITALDGEISQFGSYEYNVHYFLGDLVELKDSDGTTSKMRVTEQIRVHDVEGKKSYPTLIQDVVIDEGVWYGKPASLEWDDVDAGLEWADA